MKYKVIVQLSAEELIICVNKAIDEGWKPLGGVCLSVSERNIAYAQAMTKES